MSSTKNATFTMNELVAISAALDSQIEDCQDFLSDPDFSMDEKASIAQTLHHSKTAALKLETIFRDNHFNPQKISD